MGQHVGERQRELLVQVLLERRLGVDRDVVEARREPVLGVVARVRLPVEGARDVVAGGDLRDDRPQPAARGDEPDGGRDRRLPDAALPRDDEQLLGELAQASPSQ